jgi:hypothetical protein
MEGGKRLYRVELQVGGRSVRQKINHAFDND